MSKSAEQHLISKAENGFQLVYNDDTDQEIKIYGKFTWKSGTEEVTQVDFTLQNTPINRTGFKIHKVLFCKKLKRLEVHISRHSNFENTFQYSCNNQDVTGLIMTDKQEVEMMIRLTDNSRTSDEKKECIDGGPIVGDKDGSILIGQRP